MNFFLEFNAQKRTEIDVKLTEFRHLKVAIFTCSDKSNEKNKE